MRGLYRLPAVRRTSDTDPARDWYSGGDQDTLTAPSLTWDDQRSLLTEVRVTLVVADEAEAIRERLREELMEAVRAGLNGEKAG